MFTGIIQGLGRVHAVEASGGDRRLIVDREGAEIGEIGLGDSVSVDGVCLTATTLDARFFAADVSAETLAVTTLGERGVGDTVNLEPALRAGDPLGGHLVSGHVDGIGRLAEREPDGRSWRLVFEMPGQLARFVAAKGSICVDGISLTVNAVDDRRFTVNIVPHTMEQTSLGERGVGDRVNLEIDQVARYLARLVDQGAS